MKKVEQKSIEEKELKKLQEFDSFLKEANEVLGKLTSDFEFKKSDVLRQMNEKLIKLEEFKKELSDTYGKDITIDLATGVISEQKPE